LHFFGFVDHDDPNNLTDGPIMKGLDLFEKLTVEGYSTLNPWQIQKIQKLEGKNDYPH